MDANNWRSSAPNGQATMDIADWRTQLQPDSRQRIVNKIMETLRRHPPCSGDEGLNELRKMAVRFEEKIYTAASSQSDYLRRISLKMLTMETMSQNTLPNPGNGSKLPDPASLDSTGQTGHGDDWQEEVFQKIKSMKDMYLGELNDMYQKITAKVQQHESMSQQLRPEQFDKLKVFKAMLECIIAFISVSSKEKITHQDKEKLGTYEKQIVNILTSNRLRKPAQQG